jgi:hypothetical protein
MPRDQVKDNKQHKHADDGDCADDSQRHFVETPPIAPRRLLDRVGLGIGDAAETTVFRRRCKQGMTRMLHRHGMISRMRFTLAQPPGFRSDHIA